MLLLIGAIELAGKGGVWLPYVAGLYIIARVLHPLGMDKAEANWMRGAGVMVTMLTLLGLAIYAALVGAGVL